MNFFFLSINHSYITLPWWNKFDLQLALERTPKYRTWNTPNIECLNIELSEHDILAQNQTSNMSNITKNRTVREHQTVCSKSSLVTYITTGLNFEYFLTSHFGPKPNFEHHKKLNSSRTSNCSFHDYSQYSSYTICDFYIGFFFLI